MFTMALSFRVAAADCLGEARILAGSSNSTSSFFSSCSNTAASNISKLLSCLCVPSHAGDTAVRLCPLFVAPASAGRSFSRSLTAPGSPPFSSFSYLSALPFAPKPLFFSSSSLVCRNARSRSCELRDDDRLPHGVLSSTAESVRFTGSSSAPGSGWVGAFGGVASPGSSWHSDIVDYYGVLTPTAGSAEAGGATSGPAMAPTKARKAEKVTPVRLTAYLRDGVSLASISFLLARAATSTVQYKVHLTAPQGNRQFSVLSSCFKTTAAANTSGWEAGTRARTEALMILPESKQRLQLRWMYTRPGGRGSSSSARHPEALLPFQKRLRVSDLVARKRTGEKISMVTAYDACSAEILDNALIDMLLVGDSLANVVFGLESTAQIDFDTMLLFSKHVRRATRRAIVVFDFPYGSYHTTALAVDSAVAVVKQTGITTVKFEGFFPDTVKALSDHVNVICHLGVQPQTAESMASRGRKARDAMELLEQSLEMEAAEMHAFVHKGQETQDISMWRSTYPPAVIAYLQDCSGCKMVLLEKVCAEVADAITARLKIPTIGIGSGPGCDGQVLVFHDLVGYAPSTAPFKFVKQYCQLHRQIASAAAEYKQDIDAGRFPGISHSFFMPPHEREKFFSSLAASAVPAATSRVSKGVADPSRGIGKELAIAEGDTAKSPQADAFTSSASKQLTSSCTPVASPAVSSASAPAPAELLSSPPCSSAGTAEGTLTLVQQWIRQEMVGPGALISPLIVAPAKPSTSPAAAGAQATGDTNSGFAVNTSAIYASGTEIAETGRVSVRDAARTETTTIAEDTVRGGVAPAATETKQESPVGRENEPEVAARVAAFVQKTRRIGVRGGGAMGQFLAYMLAGVPHISVTLITKRAELRAASLSRGGSLLLRSACNVKLSAEAEERGVGVREIRMLAEEGRGKSKKLKTATAARDNNAVETNLPPQKGTPAHSHSDLQALPPGLQVPTPGPGIPPSRVSAPPLSGVQTASPPDDPKLLSDVQGRQVRVVIEEAEIPKAYFDAVIICTKSWQTKEAAAFAVEKTAPGGVVTTVQNGLEAPRLLQDAIKNASDTEKRQQKELQDKKHQETAQEDLSLVIAPSTYGVREEAPGIALMTGKGDFRICPATSSARVAAGAVAALLQRAGTMFSSDPAA